MLAGPLDLIQGGRGLVARVPVFAQTDPPGGSRYFWGLISAVIDVDRFSAASGLTDPPAGLAIALRGKDGKGSAGEVILGDPELFEQHAVILDIPLPSGSWQLAGMPESGWPRQADNAWLVRSICLVIALLVAGPFLSLGVSMRSLAAARREVEEANSDLRILSITDPLTRIPNRRAFEERLAQEVRNAARAGVPLSLLMIDIDYFKPYNDNYGHHAGDVALTQIAGAIAGSLPRSTDFAARLGGEEFVVVLPATDAAGASEVAERVHGRVHELDIRHGYARGRELVTVSIGVCARSGQQLSGKALMKGADEALYAAKAAGRDRTEIAPDGDPAPT